jgi:hypothetical protein
MPTQMSTDKILAFAFGVVFVVVMLYIAIYVPNPTDTQSLNCSIPSNSAAMALPD